ncbi:MAG TPA: hypothetical protein VJ952_00730 [Opitutales bacterium]|nr:hypothetical protein [Opitutales bacterium]
MSSKTISLSEQAYRRLQRQRQGPGDSFSRIVMRARWEDESVTAGELLDLWQKEPPFFTDSELDAIGSAKLEQPIAPDKWSAY